MGKGVCTSVVRRVVPMTDTRNIAHLVSDEAVAAGRRSGRYVAVCGADVLATSLTVETGKLCQCCQKRVAQ